MGYGANSKNSIILIGDIIFGKVKTEAMITEVEEVKTISEIDGLTYIRNFISQSEQDLLLQKIYQQPWLTDLKRRVQHYGYKYDYTKHVTNQSMYIGALPDWSLAIASILHQSYSLTFPDQMIVSEYEPGQGVAAHVDCKTCFGDSIISLSLASACLMDFSHKEKGEKMPILLEPMSLIVMQGEARYEWKHAIAKRKSDRLNGQVVKRKRRVSLTFRNVILSD